MCGLVGVVFFDTQRSLDREVLVKMTRRLAHRGPDDEGLYQGSGCSLGFRRLSILDLSAAGHQPMANETGKVWMVCNGEIYNFRELRKLLEIRGHQFRSHADVEVIVHGYEEWGEHVLDHLDGMFAMAVWDETTKKLLLARDRFGIKPLHYALRPEGVVFGSEIKSLLAYPDLPTDLDWHALWNYLTFAQVPAPESIYRSVRKLLPGHKMTVEQGRVRIEQYYELPLERKRAAPIPELAAQYRALLERAVTTHLVADVPVGCFLSGGIDSSLLVALASIVSGRKVQTFSVEFVGAADVDESRYQTLVAKRFDTEHHVLRASPDLMEYVSDMLKAVDEPFAIASFLPLYVLARMTAEHVKVVLSGDGADELFAGYAGRYTADAKRLWLGRPLACFPDRLDDGIWYNRGWMERLKRRARMARFSPFERYITSYNWFWNPEKKVLLQPEILSELGSDPTYGDWVEGAWDARLPNDMERKLRYEFLAPLPDEMLTKSDRATSAFGMEARVPYLDRTAAEFAWSIPPSLHWRNGVGKRVLKAAARGLIPDIIIDRPKAGFNVPISRWLQTDGSELKKRLLDTDEHFHEIVRPEAVRAMLAAQERREGEHGNRLWVLYILKAWIQTVKKGMV